MSDDIWTACDQHPHAPAESCQRCRTALDVNETTHRAVAKRTGRPLTAAELLERWRSAGAQTRG